MVHSSVLRRPPELRHTQDWGPLISTPSGNAYLVEGTSLTELEPWRRAFDGCRHEYRFFELVESTLREDYRYFYLILEDRSGRLCGIQPLFLFSQSVLGGVTGTLAFLAERFHRMAPNFLVFRTLMVGSPVGEGVLGAMGEAPGPCARALADALLPAARRLRASLVVLKEFSAELRPALEVFRERGYARIPSMPYVALDLEFRDFNEHLTGSLSASVRKDLRRKFRDAAAAPPIRMEILDDISGRIDELYPLYLQVYERAQLRFERVTPEYLIGLGRVMPDRARFFVWTQQGRPIAFNACTLHDGVLWAEYLGLDYRCALDLHLYFIVTRDEIDWCCANGVRRYCSTSLNYDPKLHLKFRLLPLDLYVRHVNGWMNGILARASPWLTPARHDPLLRRFSNYDML